MINYVKKRRLMAGLFCVALAVFLTGCGDKDGSSSATGPVVYTVDGSWSGTTSQSQAISFTVASNAVTYLKIKISFGSGGSVETTVWPNSCPVANNSFTLTSSGTTTLTVKGSFTSNTAANGTFEYGSTTGTWTARR
jgi:hypothetical protein